MLKVNEIFYSLQGESTFAGLPCLFIRLTGCNLRCRYCDTRYAYEEGSEFIMDQLLNQVSNYRCQMVEITGGEPLLQDEVPDLAKSLINCGKTVLVETNGTLDIGRLPNSVIRIMDLKCPSSNESEKTDWDNIARLKSQDNVKFVIGDRADFDWAITIVEQWSLLHRCHVLFSPVFGVLAPEKLAEWLLETGLPIRFNLQLHKYIWHPNRRGV